MQCKAYFNISIDLLMEFLPVYDSVTAQRSIGIRRILSELPTVTVQYLDIHFKNCAQMNQCLTVVRITGHGLFFLANVAQNRVFYLMWTI